MSALSNIVKSALQTDARGSEQLRGQVDKVLQSLKASENVIQQADTRAKDFITGYKDPLLGTWVVKRWKDVFGEEYKGNLLVTKRKTPTQLNGVFRIVSLSGREVEQEMSITVGKERIHMEGRVTKGSSFYSRDVLDFTLQGDVMKGKGTSDTGPATEEIILERALKSELDTSNKGMEPTR